MLIFINSFLAIVSGVICKVEYLVRSTEKKRSGKRVRATYTFYHHWNFCSPSILNFKVHNFSTQNEVMIFFCKKLFYVFYWLSQFLKVFRYSAIFQYRIRHVFIEEKIKSYNLGILIAVDLREYCSPHCCTALSYLSSVYASVSQLF